MNDRYIRKPEILKMVGVSYPTICRMEQSGRFPKRRKIGKRAVAWLESEIIEWMKYAPISAM